MRHYGGRRLRLGVRRVKPNESINDSISYGIIGTLSIPLCDVGRSVGAKFSANIVNNEVKSYASIFDWNSHMFRHKQRFGFVGDEPKVEANAFLKVNNTEWLGGVVSSSLEVKASQEKWTKIKFGLEAKVHYTIVF